MSLPHEVQVDVAGQGISSREAPPLSSDTGIQLLPSVMTSSTPDRWPGKESE